MTILRAIIVISALFCLWVLLFAGSNYTLLAGLGLFVLGGVASIVDGVL